jgi:hypothetical protein
MGDTHTHRREGNVISLLPKIRGDTQRDGQKDDLISFLLFLAYFPIFKHVVVRVCVCVCMSVYPPIVARQLLGKNPLTVARQRLGRNVTAVTNTHATIEEFLDASFSI